MSSKNQTTPWVASVPIVVSDKEVSKKWYTEKLGLVLISNEGHWVTVGSDGRGCELHLCQASENRPNPIPLETGPSGIVFAIPGDFLKECNKLMERGVEFSHPPENAPWGWFATVRDPDGNEHYLSPTV
jgi:catechol 2,3-dioxygenase-like lactoylglutathione lyase family enzyme